VAYGVADFAFCSRAAMACCLSTAISQFIFAFGPGLIGLVRDLSGNYRAALLVCVSSVKAAVIPRWS
jgi:cyanate permease